MLFISLVTNILLFLLIGVVAFHYNWSSKISEKLGLKETPRLQDYLTTMSWNHTMESLDYEADVVFFGASLTSDGKWQDYFDTLKVCNLGKSGDRLGTMLWRVPQITAVHPKKIFLSMEQNDMHELGEEDIEMAFNTLLDTIIHANPQAILYLESLTPINERQFKRVCENRKIQDVNEIIKRIASERGLCFINLYDIYEENGQMPMSISTDGQHLKPEAYQRWKEAIEPYLINMTIK